MHRERPTPGNCSNPTGCKAASAQLAAYHPNASHLCSGPDLMASWFENERDRVAQSGRLPAAWALPERTAPQTAASARGPQAAPPPLLQLHATPAATTILPQPAPRITLATVVASAVCALSDLDPEGETATGGPHSLQVLARHAAAFLTSVRQQVVASLL